jgi:hypothetical protein
MRSPGYRIVVVSVVVVALIAGGVTIALAGSGGTTAPITKARATAYAHVVNLRAGDVPGFVAVGGSQPSEGQPFGTQESRCDPAMITAGSVVMIGSQAFQRRQKSTGGSRGYLPLEAVSSEVDVMHSAALASREIAAMRAVPHTPAVLTCLKRQLEQVRLRVTREGGARVGEPVGKPVFSHVEISALRSPSQAIPAIGLRISADFAIEVSPTKGSSHYYEDFLGFATGPVVVSLNATGSPQPFPPTTEQRLLALLHTRAEANKLS